MKDLPINTINTPDSVNITDSAPSFFLYDFEIYPERVRRDQWGNANPKPTLPTIGSSYLIVLLFIFQTDAIFAPFLSQFPCEKEAKDYITTKPINIKY